jgi:hypothetical protein
MVVGSGTLGPGTSTVPASNGRFSIQQVAARVCSSSQTNSVQSGHLDRSARMGKPFFRHGCRPMVWWFTRRPNRCCRFDKNTSGARRSAPGIGGDCGSRAHIIVATGTRSFPLQGRCTAALDEEWTAGLPRLSATRTPTPIHPRSRKDRMQAEEPGSSPHHRPARYGALGYRCRYHDDRRRL